jgi:phosphate ABC transporter, permease protein PstA
MKLVVADRKINISIKDLFQRVRRNPFEAFASIIVWMMGLCSLGIFLYIVGFICIKGIPNITPSLFEWKYNSVNVSLMPALVSTIYMTVLALLLVVPIGISAAIYMVEYAKSNNRIVKIIQITTETLAGIPSIVYGLFGLLFFVTFLKWSYSMLAGAFTLAIMILPLIMRASEEALKAVPDNYREGSYGLGTGKLRTVFKIVLPSAMPGIFAGVILSIGRIVGETVALIYTAGTVAQIPNNPMQSARTLSVHMFALSSEGLHTKEAYATAVVLLLAVMIINASSAMIAKKFGGKR